MYSEYKLNKHGDNIQPWCTPFPIWNQSVPRPVLTVASWPAYKFLKRQVRWSGIPISFRIFQFIVIHTVKSFGIVNKAEIDVSLELSGFFDDPVTVGNLISGSYAFSISSLNIWNFTVHTLLKPGLENSELYLVSLWDECNCVVVYLNGLPLPSPMDLPDPGIKPTPPVSPALQVDSWPTEPLGKPTCGDDYVLN